MKKSKLLEKDNIGLKKKDNKKHKKMISDIDVEIKELTEIKNMLTDENDGLKERNSHLQQEINLLHGILDELEKDKAKLKK